MDHSNDESLRQALITDIMHRLFDESIPRIKACLQMLSGEQIWWRPNENSNSIGNLVLHLDGNVRQWILSGIAGNEDRRKRQHEFDARESADARTLISMLESLQDDTRHVIRDITLHELLRKRPVQIYHETGVSILVHVTEHFSYHTGQIAYITKMILDRQLHFYDDSALG